MDANINTTVDIYKINMTECLNNLDNIYKNSMKQKNSNNIMDYLLDKQTYLDITKNVNKLDLLYKDRMLANDATYCNFVMDFTQPKMRKINSIIKMYGKTMNKLLNINKNMTQECHGEDSNHFFISLLNALQIVFNSNGKSKSYNLCPICPACDDKYFKVMYRNICFTMVIMLMLCGLILLFLFDIKLKFRF